MFKTVTSSPHPSPPPPPPPSSPSSPTSGLISGRPSLLSRISPRPSLLSSISPRPSISSRLSPRPSISSGITPRPSITSRLNNLGSFSIFESEGESVAGYAGSLPQQELGESVIGPDGRRQVSNTQASLSRGKQPRSPVKAPK
eukprot:TRINITY_DN46177_c0_g1_i1.p4 TRINITY_DN46177_c0_g1~~TRINITY_DN46177_c0_g1_i1.p4  ORF type:complete len:143 (+),score=5.40 TRINITY_DN46177_c0_g1_i1:1-429(+)